METLSEYKEILSLVLGFLGSWAGIWRVGSRLTRLEKGQTRSNTRISRVDKRLSDLHLEMSNQLHVLNEKCSWIETGARKFGKKRVAE